jgi:BioD-like phosphotransacetylase family protein
MKKIFVAATRQNDGKTIVSMGLMAAVKSRFSRVGYIKPVGQKYLLVNGTKVDKDAVLMKEVYGVEGDLADMNPVAVPQGFTEEYIHNGKRHILVRKIRNAFDRLRVGKQFMLVEGTGHAGVGSVFDMSNSDVASLLNCKAILVATGGIGRPIDEIMLNKTMFDRNNVKLVGVIINKVQPEKIKKIEPLVRDGLAKKKIAVLGVIPFCEPLSSPTMEQLLEDLQGRLLSGEKGLNKVVHRMLIGAMSPHEALSFFGKGTLLITPGSREDIILAAMSGSLGKDSGTYGVSGIILTGNLPPHRIVRHLIRGTDIPVIHVMQDTFSVASHIHDLIVKVRPRDTEKIKATEHLIEKYVDIDNMIDLCQ